MAPAHSTHPRVQQHQQHQQRDQSANSDIVEHGLFLEPMMGTPLAMYVHKDVPDHDRVVDLITVSLPATRGYTYPPSRVLAVMLSLKITTTVSGCAMFSLHVCSPRRPVLLTQFFQKNGGTVANSYSGVSYILGMRRSIPRISRMIIYITTTHCNSEPAHRVWTESISSIYWKEGQGCPRRALGT